MRDFVSRTRLGFARLKNRLRDERGVVLVVVTAAMTTLTLFTGIVLDVGIVMEERRQIQNAVDAASLAAARAARDNPGTAVAVANQYLLLNGVDPADPSVTVTVNQLYGTDQVEISVTAATPTAFFRIANINSKDVTVRSVGEALSVGAGNYAMVALSKTACDAFLSFGNPTLNITGGGIMVNSNCPNYAMDISGNATINADSLDFYSQGAALVSGNAVTTPAPSSAGSQVTNPLVGLAIPVVGISPDSGGTEASPAVKKINGSGLVTLNPGTYWGGLNILGNVDVTLNPGIYVMAAGDFLTWGDGLVTGSEVMIYLTGPNPADCGRISMIGNRSINFTPHSTGTYAGITFWQDSNCTANFEYYGNVTGVNGVIYAPGARFDLFGNVDLGSIQVIADTMSIWGNVTMNLNFTSYVGDTGTGKVSITE